MSILPTLVPEIWTGPFFLERLKNIVDENFQTALLTTKKRLKALDYSIIFAHENQSNSWKNQILSEFPFTILYFEIDTYCKSQEFKIDVYQEKFFYYLWVLVMQHYYCLKKTKRIKFVNDQIVESLKYNIIIIIQF